MEQDNVDVMSLPEVPEDVLPRGDFPPLRYRGIPEARPWYRMIGPSIIVAGLAIGSGELIFWPYLTYVYGLAIIWAGIVGVSTQFFMNMEIERYTLLTAETSVVGFTRVWKHFSILFFVCCVVPFVWPGWVAGAARIMAWIFHSGAPESAIDGYQRTYSILSVIACGAALVLSPVVYKMMEKVQMVLVSFVFITLAIATITVSKWSTMGLFVSGATDFSYLGKIAEANAWPLLFGAIAYAGLGGMGNMIQGHYIREKGFSMGRYAARIVSPLTGKEEAVVGEAGYLFEMTPENLVQWRGWWRSANLEHVFSFLLLTALSIVLLSFLSYHTVFGVEGYTSGISFIKGEAEVLTQHFGPTFKWIFLWMGWAILFTSQIGALDLISRLSTDIIKWSWVRDIKSWTESRIYVVLVLIEVTFAVIIFATGARDPRTLLTIGAAFNGCVMFVYSGLLLYMNSSKLPKPVRMGNVRIAIMCWAVLFYGVFSVYTVKATIQKLIAQ